MDGIFIKRWGSHYQYKHNNKLGKITIPRHCKELKNNSQFYIKTSGFKTPLLLDIDQYTERYGTKKSVKKH